MIAYYVVGGVLIAGIIALIPVGYVLSDIAPYAYTNAKLRAKRSDDLDSDTLAGYAGRSFEDIIQDLAKKHSIDLARFLGARAEYAAIDTAVRNHHIETIDSIRRSAPQQYNTFLSAYQERFKLRAIRNIIRKQHVDLSEIARLLPDKVTFTHGLRSKDNITVDDIIDELQSTPYAEPINEYTDELRSGSYKDVEVALQKTYLGRLRKRAPTDTAKRFIKAKIDRLNLSACLKNASVYCEGGRIPAADLHPDLSTDELNELLHDANYDLTIQDPTTFERDFNAYFADHAAKLTSRQPLSDNIIIASLIETDRTHRDLRVLLKLAYHDASETRIEEALTT